MNLLLIITLSLMGCVSSSDKGSISKIEIKAVDFEIETFVSVTCDDFESSFEKEMKVVEITQQTRLNELNQIIGNLMPDKNNYVPDVRAKMMIYYDNNQKDSLCVSSLGVLFNGKSILQSNELVTFIKENTLK